MICLETNEKFRKISIQCIVYLVQACSNRPNPPTQRILSTLIEKTVLAYTIIKCYDIEFPREVRVDEDLSLTITERFGILSIRFIPIYEEISDNSEINSKEALLATKILCVDSTYEGCQKAIFTIITSVHAKFPEQIEHAINNHLIFLNYHFSTHDSVKFSTPNEFQQLINSLIFYDIFFSQLAFVFQEKMSGMVLSLVDFVSCQYTLIRHLTSKCLAVSLCHLPFNQSHDIFLSFLFPMLDNCLCEYERLGSIETIYSLLSDIKKEPNNLNFLFKISSHLMIPVLRRMNDSCPQIRYISSYCLSQILYYIPLNFSVKLEKDNEEEENKKKDLYLLNQLLNPTAIESFRVPFELVFNLRSYQQDGINWMNFLRELNLNGALCDDMGLGKTIQSLLIISSDYFLNGIGPSLIICPKILCQHWFEECNKYIPSTVIQPKLIVAYNKLIHENFSNKLCIASYDQVRKNSDFFGAKQWNYLVLDEAHIIKNSKSKIFKSVIKITALHKLVVTGTPIQNDVLELWALFDFLMPGFLGTYRQFNERYAKPIVKSRDSKCSTVDYDKGNKALESLHKRCLPFILRRKKEDVLKELPPKIIQDFYCELDGLQKFLYQSYVNTPDFNILIKNIDKIPDINEIQQNKHIFEKMVVLRKICNHLSLVINKNEMEKLNPTVENDSIFGIKSNCKLYALKQLLEICGFKDTNHSDSEIIISDHKIIIFAQNRNTLDIIQKHLLEKYFTNILFVRLDGSVKYSQRYENIDQFNSNPSIHVLLATTSIGGLGLNLTGADTVIFYDHDWNPMKDLQAMDRAHRIGQKKTVSVYRIICKDTIEEKIMNLQSFKFHLANTVVSQENEVADIKSNKIIEIIDDNSLDRHPHDSKTIDDNESSFDLTNDYQNLFSKDKIAEYIEKMKKRI